MNDDIMDDPEELRRELKRLRAAFKKLGELDIGDGDFARKFALFKDQVKTALDRVGVLRKTGTERRLQAIAKARKVNKDAAQARWEAIAAEIAAIEAEAGRSLSSYALAQRMNERGNIAPFAAIEWQSSTLRYALKAIGLDTSRTLTKK